jgi:hypothetical protein
MVPAKGADQPGNLVGMIPHPGNGARPIGFLAAERPASLTAEAWPGD